MKIELPMILGYALFVNYYIIIIRHTCALRYISLENTDNMILLFNYCFHRRNYFFASREIMARHLLPEAQEPKCTV